ncbi:MAG: poly(3-hydroxyalkanoate) depolymerase [Steroidobacteraceae bacterium]
MTAALHAADLRRVRGPRIEFVDIDGVSLRIAHQSGTGKQPPLLLFNGIGANLEVLFPFIAAMPDREVVAFDVPGTGGSPMSWRVRRFAGLARLASALLDRMGLRTVDVAGVSWGGALAQQFARQFPQRCRRLVLAATSPGAVMIPGRPSALLKMITPQRYLSPGYMRRAAGDIYGGEVRERPSLINRHTSRIVAPKAMGYVYQLMAGAGWTSLHWLHRLRQPTLVLAGSDDPLVPAANARILALLIPNSELHIIPGGGHLFMLYRLEQVIPLIDGFLDRN